MRVPEIPAGRPGSGSLLSLLGTLALASIQIACTPPKPSGFQAQGPDARAANLVIRAIGGNGQSGVVSHDFNGYLVASVTDPQDQPVAGADVSWSVVSGSATIVRSTDSSINLDGTSAVNVRAGTVSGPITVRASVAGGGSATFSLNAVSDVASSISVASGNNQVQVVARTLAAPLTAIVRDQYGNPVPNIVVDFTVTAQGGTVNPTDATTAAAGTVATSLTLGTVAGPATVRAQVRGTSLSTTFNASAVADVPVSIVKTAGDNQTGPRGSALPIAPQVLVRDIYGNACQAIRIDWAVTGGSGSFSPTSSNTAFDGQASSSWTLGSRGTNTATATVNGTSLSVTFNATASPIAFTQTWTFDAVGASTAYSFSPTKVDFAGTSALLKYADQTDDDSSSGGFGGGVFAGVLWDGVKNELKLGNFGGCDGSTTNCSAVAGSTLSGSFTSRVMDPGAIVTGASWLSLQWQTAYPYGKELPGAAASEAASDYPSIAGGLMTGNVGLWHFNETASNSVSGGLYDAADSSGNNNHGTESAALAYGQAGRLNTAIHFDGTGRISFQNIAIPSAAAARTVSLWFMKDAAGTQSIFAYGSTVGTDRIFELSVVNGNLVFSSGDGDTSAVPAPVSNGVWHLASATYDGSNVRVYLDGTLVATQAFALATSTGSRRIGGGILYGNFIGSIDEVGLWSRALSGAEIAEIYRRGAARLRFQVRSCALADCSDGTFVGSAGTATSYFSEINSSALTAPNLAFSAFGVTLASRRYYQYRAVFDAIHADPARGPTLRKVAAGPDHYEGNWPTIANLTTVDYATLATFTETLGAAGCTGGIRYVISPDSATWYYWNGTAWSASNSTYAQASPAATVNAQIASFPAAAGLGNLYWKLYLPTNSTGLAACEITDLTVTGTN